jgi:putative ABC transport system permease protein
MDIKMAWRNIWRNKRRTLLTISAIAFAGIILVFMLSFQFGSYDAMINASVKIYTGHLQIQEKSYRDKQGMRKVVESPEAVIRIIKKTPGIEAYTTRANAFALVSSKERTYGIMVTGIDPVLESGVTTIKKLIKKGKYLTEEDADHALVGKLLAENLKVTIGDELTVLGQGRDGSVAAAVFRVKGIFKSGMDEFDRNAIQIPLKYFQDVFSMNGAVHEVVVTGKSLSDLSNIKRSISMELDSSGDHNKLVALDWKDLMPGLAQGISMDLVSGLITYFILIMVVAFSILNTFLMAILERTREFGVLMAIGTTPGRLTRLVLLESGAMTLVGIATGIIAGSAITLYFQKYGIDIAGASEILNNYGISGRLYPRLSILSASLGPAMVLVITFLAALYPALKIKQLKPVEAMTHV